MDTLTHALSGALVARVTAAPTPGPGALPLGRRVFVGFLAAAFLDLDFVAAYVSPVTYLLHHRGLTHSLLLLPIWAFLLACLCALVWRHDRNWRAYFGVIALGIGAHIAGDWITSFGTMVFAPLSDVRVALSTTFIIDLWFSGIVLAGLAASWLWQRSRAPATVALALLVGYVGAQGVLQQEAVKFGQTFAQAAGLSASRVTALPRPVSPFNWMVLVEEGERYHYSFVNLARRSPLEPRADAGFFARLTAPYLPPDQAVWVRAERYGVGPIAQLAREAWRAPTFEFFRWFADYPVLHSVDAGNPSTCVWFQDLRFFTPGREAWPFRYGLCREENGPWRPFRLEGDRGILAVY